MGRYVQSIRPWRRHRLLSGMVPGLVDNLVSLMRFSTRTQRFQPVISTSPAVRL